MRKEDKLIVILYLCLNHQKLIIRDNYIVYTDNSIDEEGNIRVYASIYNPADLQVVEGEELAALELIPIETEKEWKIIETILEEMQNQVEEEQAQ